MRGLTYWKLLAIKDLIYLSIKCTEIPSYQGCVRKGFSINTVALRCQCFPPHFRVFYLFSDFSSSFFECFLLSFLQNVFFLFFSVFSSLFFESFLRILFTKSFPPIFLQKVSFLFFTKSFLPIFINVFFLVFLRVSFQFFCKKFPSYFYQCFHPRVLRIFFLFYCKKFPFYFFTKSFLPIFLKKVSFLFLSVFSFSCFESFLLIF